MVIPKEVKVTWEEWSKKIADKAERITEQEINETMKKLKNGDFSVLGPDIRTEEQAHEHLYKVWKISENKLEQAKKLFKSRKNKQVNQTI
jgi:capsule polysaccharide modification protein KpsS